jgi:transcriptional regulator
LADNRIVLPQGTLDLLILKVISLGPQHGWAISERLDQVSTGVVQVQQGSLYPALHRLERRGWIAAEWGPSDNNRNAKYYRLSASGRKQLEQHQQRWQRISFAITSVLEGA